MNKGWQFLIMLIISTAVVVGATWTVPQPKPEVHEQALIPPPIHVEWERYDVGGHFLVAPPDGTTTPRSFLKLPEGTMLLVPRLVKGESPEQKKSKT